MASVLSTAMSRLNTFLDSEMEQILCFDSTLDTETFCTTKAAIFIVLPEEDNTKYFMVSLFLQQLYREMLSIADEHGGKLPNRVMVFADEIGTIPKIESMEMMFSAGRSRRISMVPIIQSFAQLQKNYGKEGSSFMSISALELALAACWRSSCPSQPLIPLHRLARSESLFCCSNPRL